MTKFREKILALQAVITQKRAALGALTEENEELRVRLAALLLLHRVSLEVQRHRCEHSAAGGLCGAFEEQMQVLEEEIRQGGTGGPQEQQRGPRLPAGGAGGAGGVQLCSFAALLGGSPGDDTIQQRLPHLAARDMISPISYASPEEVQAARSEGLEEVMASWHRLVEEGRAAIAEGPAGEGRLRDVGVRIARLIHLGVIWAFSVHIRVGTHHNTTLEPAVGLKDAPVDHWSAVLVAAKLTRFQARVLLEILEHHRRQVGQLAASRAEVAARLSAADAAANAAVPVAALAYRGAASDTLDEAVAELEALMRAEVQCRTEFGVVSHLVSSPAQLARWYCACHPYPVNSEMMSKAIQLALKFDDAAFAPDPADGGPPAGSRQVPAD